MGVSTVQSAAVFGLRVELVNVEADVGNGLPAFHMVGYPVSYTHLTLPTILRV